MRKLEPVDSFTLAISLSYFLFEFARSYKLEATDDFCEVTFLKPTPLGFDKIRIKHDKGTVDFFFSKMMDKAFDSAQSAFKQMSGISNLKIDEANNKIVDIEFHYATRILKALTAFTREMNELEDQVNKESSNRSAKIIDLSHDMPIGTKLQ